MFVQELFKASNVGIGSGPYTPSGSKTVTVGNRIYVLIGIPDPGTTFTCTDSLGNTYTQEYELEGIGILTNTKLVLFSAPVTVGGTLTSIQIDWTNNTTAVGLVSAEFTDEGPLLSTAEAGLGSGTSGPVSVGSISGLLFYAFTAFDTISGFTPPSGFTIASGITVAGQGEQIYLCYKEGTASGIVQATWSTSREWHAVASAHGVAQTLRVSYDDRFVI